MNQEIESTERFSGVLDRIQLIEVVQSACLAGEDRKISVESDFGMAVVQVRSGQAVYCKADEGMGENAIKRVLLWPGGYFRSEPDSDKIEQNVSNPWEGLLIEAVRFRNEMRQDPTDMGALFSGKFSGIGLTDLVQLTCMAGTERQLHLESGELQGLICFREGRVFHSQCGETKGEQAFRELITAKSGRFASRPLDGEEAVTINLPLEKLFAPPSGEETGEGAIELSMLQKLQRMRTVEKIRAAMTGNQETRSLLIRETNRMVQLAVIANPKLNEGEVALIASYKHVDDEVLRRIATSREWMRLVQVRLALVKTPNAPFRFRPSSFRRSALQT